MIASCVRSGGGEPAATAGNRSVVGPVERAAAECVVVDELVPEVLDPGDDRAGRAVTESTERPSEDVVAGVEQGLDVLLGADPGLQALEDLDHPIRPLATRRAIAARLVRVELGEAQTGPHHADRVVHDQQRGRAEQRTSGLHTLEVEWGVEVLLGQQRRARSTGGPGLQLAVVADTAAELEQLP